MKRKHVSCSAARTVALILMLSLLLPLCGCSDFYGMIGVGDFAWQVHQMLHPAQHCTVTFDHNDGSGIVEKRTVPTIKDVSERAPCLTKENLEHRGWSLTPYGEIFSGNPEEGMTLYAVWYDPTLTVYKDRIPEALREERVRIDVRGDPSVLEDRTLYVEGGCKELTILSNGTEIENFSIYINGREEDLSLNITDLCFTFEGDCGIQTAMGIEECTVAIDVSGECTVRPHAWWRKGEDCLRVRNLCLSGNGTLRLTAGEGERNGQDGGSAIVASTVTVRDVTLYATGGKGGEGSQGSYESVNGGDGGSGGYAIDADSISAYGASLILTGGDGGKGGDGNCYSAEELLGAGGDGGSGGAAIRTSPFGGVVLNDCRETLCGGKGGDGGKGGEDFWGYLTPGADGAPGLDGGQITIYTVL